LRPLGPPFTALRWWLLPSRRHPLSSYRNHGPRIARVITDGVLPFSASGSDLGITCLPWDGTTLVFFSASFCLPGEMNGLNRQRVPGANRRLRHLQPRFFISSPPLSFLDRDTSGNITFTALSPSLTSQSDEMEIVNFGKVRPAATFLHGFHQHLFPTFPSFRTYSSAPLEPQ